MVDSSSEVSTVYYLGLKHHYIEETGVTKHNGRDPCRMIDFKDDDNILAVNEVEVVDIDHEDGIDNLMEPIGDIHARIPEELIPKHGQEFESEKSAHEFYLEYAKAVGFGVRISKGHKDKRTGLHFDRIFCCAREGKKENNTSVALKFQRANSRCNCGAEMKISCRGTAKYHIVRFIADHNHVFASPSKTHIFRSHRMMTDAQKAGVDIAISCGIAQKETMELMTKQVGGPEYLGFIHDDCKNYLHSKRTQKMRVGDTGGVLGYLQQKQGEDPNFFYAIQVDEEDLITNIFWADAKMRKHKDGRPIALFVGVNNHKQTSVFGAALLYDETALTFAWLFDTFAKAMRDKKPQTILTDQDKAMSKALTSQWKGTYHRLCVWHINKNAALHLGHVFSKYKSFAKDFSSCMYDHENEVEFITAWNVMLAEYDLQDNKWLKELYEIREKWALVYGRETFCADMSTTQHSESMNSVIKKYISYKNELVEFFEHFERLLKDHRYKESLADHKNNQSEPSSTLPVQISKHAAKIYTHKIFELFHEEVCKAHDCSLVVCGEKDARTKYNVKYFKERHHHRVTYDFNNGLVSCSCKKFEFVGILCSHALRVLNLRQIVRIPDEYIKKRWTKTAKRQSEIVQCYDLNQLDPKEAPGYRYLSLCQLSNQLTTRAAESAKAYEIAKQGLQKLLEHVNASFEENEAQEQRSDTKSAHIPISDPIGVIVEDCIGSKNVRGIKIKEKVTYKNSKRPKSCLEMLTRKRKSVATVPRSTHKGIVPEKECTLYNPCDQSHPAKDLYIEPHIPVSSPHYIEGLNKTSNWAMSSVSFANSHKDWKKQAMCAPQLSANLIEGQSLSSRFLVQPNIGMPHSSTNNVESSSSTDKMNHSGGTITDTLQVMDPNIQPKD